jgi:hypothetical protein
MWGLVDVVRCRGIVVRIAGKGVESRLSSFTNYRRLARRDEREAVHSKPSSTST